MDLRHFKNIHAHNIIGPEIVTNLDPDMEIDTPMGDAWYSVGIHPWNTAEANENNLHQIAILAQDPRVAAIGECGIDKLKGAQISKQEHLFIAQAKIAETVGKPIIIHCVKAWDTIIRLKKQLSPSVPWIIHGFRGKKELARQLVLAGFYISIGSKYNPEAIAEIPPQRLLHETDTDEPYHIDL